MHSKVSVGGIAKILLGFCFLLCFFSFLFWLLLLSLSSFALNILPQNAASHISRLSLLVIAFIDKVALFIAEDFVVLGCF